MTVQIFIVKQVDFAKSFLLAICLMLETFFVFTREFRHFLDALVFTDTWQLAKCALIQINLRLVVHVVCEKSFVVLYVFFDGVRFAISRSDQSRPRRVFFLLYFTWGGNQNRIVIVGNTPDFTILKCGFLFRKLKK